MRDFLLRNVRENGMKKPWQKMTEGEQRLEIERATEKADELIDAIVDIVASGDFPVVHAIIDNYTSKNGEVKIVAKGVAEDDVILNLHHAGKKPVKIVIADRLQFDHTRTNLEPDPDEPGLPGVKQELQPEDLGGFDDDVVPEGDAPVQEPAPFDDDAEQAEGAAALKPKSDQWRGGFNSRMGGHKRDDNPFNPGSPESADWFEGWDAADFDDQAPAIKATPDSDVVAEADAMVSPDVAGEPQPEPEQTGAVTGETSPGPHYDEGRQARDAGIAHDQNPYVKNPMKSDWSDGWQSRDSELPGEDTPADGHDPDTGEVPFSEADLADARTAGAAARKDGQGPKRNPHDKESPLNAAWTEGYLAQKKNEEKGASPDDAAFDD